MKKTNAMRILDKSKIEYKVHEYESDYINIDGLSVAKSINKDPKIVFKTLVCQGKSNYYVAMIPVGEELDLKACATVLEEKNIELIAVKELFPLTGYIRGGCSPIGMKKQFKTLIDSSYLENEFIIFSAGAIGSQLEIKSSFLPQIIPLISANIIK